ncbi:DNA-binding protein [Microcystis wesenbergii]|uniref:DNA-binding protein n=1 Tax=Microcystis wesenbergii TaxID=44823 RepID=UPI00168036E0|nr:DNA-binding protein [Microcystis wesenbergii]MBD2117378.1 hypothetical protein [Microcystis wesenbergii FACHB-1339]
MTDYSYKDYQPYYVKRSPKPGYFTLREIKTMAVPGWPQSIEGLRKKAIREGWPRLGRRPSKGGAYEYRAGLPD